MKRVVMSPVRLFLICMAAWLVSWVVGPFSFPFSYPLIAGVLLALTAAAFALGCLTGQSLARSATERSSVESANQWVSSASYVRTLWSIILLAVGGEILRAYDRVALRGLDLASSLAQIRLDLVEAGQSLGWVGVVSGFLYPFCFPAYVLARLGWHRLSTVTKALLIAVCCFPVIEGFLQGGIIAGAMTLLFYYFVNKAIPLHRGKPARQRRWMSFFIPALVLAGFVIVATGIFVDRVELIFGDLVVYMQIAEEMDVVEYEPVAYELVERFGAAGFVPIWLMHYYTMGIHKFFYLVSNFDTDAMLYGSYQLYVPLKLLAALGIGEVSLERFAALNPLPGHYQTFWGPAYMDFGLGMPIEGLLIGVICGLAYRWCKTGVIAGLALYPYLQANIVLGFLANGITGERAYFFVSLGILCLVATRSVTRMRIRGLAHQ